MRWLWKNPMLGLVCVLFMVSTGFYVRNRIKFWDVENWPSVNAEEVRESGSVDSVPVQTRTGSGLMRIGTLSVRFQYKVQGILHHGELASPDGGGLPLNPTTREGKMDSGGEPMSSLKGTPLAPWRAYYKPLSPEIAVINPIPYQGTRWLGTAAVSGLLVLVHLYGSLPWFDPRKSRSQHKHPKKPIP